MTSMSFKGVTAADMGVVVLDYPPIIKPQARIKTVTVPGRSGTLTLHDPEAVYEPVDKTGPVQAAFYRVTGGRDGLAFRRGRPDTRQ